MLRLTRVFFLLAILGLASGGCESSPGSPSREIKMVTLEAASREAALTLALGSEVKLELPPPRESGHVWEIVQNDTRFLQPLGALVLGNTHRWSASFQAVRAGHTRLKFLAASPTRASGDVAADYYDVSVTIE